MRQMLARLHHVSLLNSIYIHVAPDMQIATGENVRIGAAENDAEVAAGYWYDDFTGYSYLTTNYQNTRHSDAADTPRISEFTSASMWRVRP